MFLPPFAPFELDLATYGSAVLSSASPQSSSTPRVLSESYHIYWIISTDSYLSNHVFRIISIGSYLLNHFYWLIRLLAGSYIYIYIYTANHDRINPEVMQLRTDGIHHRESAVTGPVTLKAALEQRVLLMPIRVTPFWPFRVRSPLSPRPLL